MSAASSVGMASGSIGAIAVVFGTAALAGAAGVHKMRKRWRLAKKQEAMGGFEDEGEIIDIEDDMDEDMIDVTLPESRVAYGVVLR